VVDHTSPLPSSLRESSAQVLASDESVALGTNDGVVGVVRLLDAVVVDGVLITPAGQT
jgi:hypothetical protein